MPGAAQFHLTPKRGAFLLWRSPLSAHVQVTLHRTACGTVPTPSQAYSPLSSDTGHSVKSSMRWTRPRGHAWTTPDPKRSNCASRSVQTLAATLETRASGWNSFHCGAIVEPKSERRERTTRAGFRISSTTCSSGTWLPSSELLPSRTSLTARCETQQCRIMRSYRATARASPSRVSCVSCVSLLRPMVLCRITAVSAVSISNSSRVNWQESAARALDAHRRPCSAPTG